MSTHDAPQEISREATAAAGSAQGGTGNANGVCVATMWRGRFDRYEQRRVCDTLIYHLIRTLQDSLSPASSL
jgi:hypothetical protein